MNDQADRWHALASRIGIRVIAPVTIIIGHEGVTFTALLPQFGGKEGMIADPDWNAIEPYTDDLLKLGYGYSAVEIGSSTDDESRQQMLRDWGWSATEPKPNWW